MREKRPKEKTRNLHLRRERELRGWSQATLAERIGTTEHQVNRWENGLYNPGRYSQTKLCELFGKDAEQLGFMGVQKVTKEELYVTLNTDVGAVVQLSSSHLPNSQRVVEQEPPLWNTEVETSKENIFVLPNTVVQLETFAVSKVPDCMTWFGLKIAEAVILVHQWYSMPMFYNQLQEQLDEEFKKLELMKNYYPLQEYTLSRRNFLITLAALPTALLASQRQKYKLTVALEELLPQCAASIIACWHLSGGSNLEAIGPILDSYLPVLVSITRQNPLYREGAATLLAQAYSLKAILAWHLDSLSSAEVYCIQALNYSDLANNINLRLTALNQYALILYYGKNFEQALSKSEEAYATLQKATREHIFPILQGRVYMYLAAFQAQQNIKQAEHTLERSCEAFVTQIASSESVPLYADCGNASQLLWDGLTHYYLGQHNEKSKKHALISLQTSGQLLPNSAIPERFRLECLNNRTLAAIQLNDMEEAVTCFEAAGQGARALGSVQRVAEVDYVLFKMRKHWPKEVRVQELSDGSKETKGK